MRLRKRSQSLLHSMLTISLYGEGNNVACWFKPHNTPIWFQHSQEQGCQKRCKTRCLPCLIFVLKKKKTHFFNLYAYANYFLGHTYTEVCMMHIYMKISKWIHRSSGYFTECLVFLFLSWQAYLKDSVPQTTFCIICIENKWILSSSDFLSFVTL